VVRQRAMLAGKPDRQDIRDTPGRLERGPGGKFVAWRGTKAGPVLRLLGRRSCWCILRAALLPGREGQEGKKGGESWTGSGRPRGNWPPVYRAGKVVPAGEQDVGHISRGRCRAWIVAPDCVGNLAKASRRNDKGCRSR
jgi:hypothetical protein